MQELLSAAGGFHYMGALVVEAAADRSDTRTRAANAERASELRKRFIGEKDPASLLQSSKLFLNDTDDGFCQDHLVQLRAPISPRGLPTLVNLPSPAMPYTIAI
jgi:hypothetical protein